MWDMSGSMQQIHADTVEGFNQYVMDLQAEEKELRDEHGDGVYTRFSLTVFDTIFEQWYTAAPVGEIPPIGMGRYVPRGYTALFDAVADTIARTEARLREEGAGDDRVLIAISTDGMENRSVEYSRYQNGAERLRKLIEAYEAKGWTFSWLVGTPEAAEQAYEVGAHAGNLMAFASVGANRGASTRASYANLSAATSSLRSAPEGAAATDFYADAGVSNDVTDVPAE